jgi:hypothetical protein
MVHIIKNKQLAAAKQRLGRVAAQTRGLSLAGTHYGQNMGFVNVSYKRSTAIDAMQQRVLDELNPLRVGMPPEQTEQMKTFTGQKHTNLERYGFATVGETYNPHITLARTLSGEPIDTEAMLPEPTSFSGMFSALGIFELGDNGTCIQQVEQFALQKE